ncbi:MAG: LacI family DNA-binding transcriptional regulator [Thermoflexales bacterium]|nr:LacI family DNA-binding transcriptional regulator [Thermoflexales bacterium]
MTRVRRNRKSVTIQDVAKAAGVSVSTVSRVQNEKDDVAPETYERVRQVIDRLGFTSSLAARSMRSQRTNVIGVIMPEVVSSYCIEVMRGINQAITQSDYDLIIYTTGDIRRSGAAGQERRYIALLNGGIADGMIVVAPAAPCFSTNVPIVAVDPNNKSPDYPAVIATNRAGASTAMAYLTGLGHRRIGFITGRLELVSANRRLQGYKEGLAAAGIPLDETLIQIGDYEAPRAIECASALLALEDPPTAIFASNDFSATGVYQAAREAGRRIPQDLSVVGFDNVRDAAFLAPPLTTVDQFISEMGSIATNMVIKLVKGEALESSLHKISTQLVIRDSCAPLATG